MRTIGKYGLHITANRLLNQSMSCIEYSVGRFECYAPQIMQNMADAQHPNGAMPTTAPEYVVFEGPGILFQPSEFLPMRTIGKYGLHITANRLLNQSMSCIEYSVGREWMLLPNPRSGEVHWLFSRLCTMKLTEMIL